MTKLLIALATTVALVAPAVTHAAELDPCTLLIQMDPTTNNRDVRVRVMCVKDDGSVETDYDEYIYFSYPKGHGEDPDYFCKVDRVERIDQHAYLIYQFCKHHETHRGPLLIRLEDGDIHIFNSEDT